MQIIQQRKRVTEVHYEHHFSYVGNEGRGFSVDCSEDGRPFFSFYDPQCKQWRFTLVSADNYAHALEGEIDGEKVIDNGIRKRSHSYNIPCVGRCSCGTEVELEGFTNTCEGCGADYNSLGQTLGDRRFWGEETGESLGDILSIP